MAAHADDLRYWYSETIGRSLTVTVPAATPTPASPQPLPPGRYVLRVLDFAGATDLWVRQGPDGDVVAGAADPAMHFRGHTDKGFNNVPLLFFMVRPSSKGGGGGAGGDDIDQLSFFAVGGTGVEVQITKVSRDKQ